MAYSTIEKYLPKTADYINSCDNRERKGHHNYCVIQKVWDIFPSLVEMTSAQLRGFDQTMANYLEAIDTPML